MYGNLKISGFMVHASLFSGIGGAEIAAEWVGWENAFHVEINPFGRKVLEYWYPNSISYEDITKTDFTPWRGKVDILTGGFPCQPFSYAGQRKGADDDRYLWPEMLRAIREIQPSWVVGENVAGLLSMVQPGDEIKMGRTDDLFEENYVYRKEQRFTLDEICEGLECAGYAVQPFVVPACAVGAPHRRDRVWIVARLAADTDCDRQRHGQGEQEPITERERTPDDRNGCKNGLASHPDEHRHPPRWEGKGFEGDGRRHVPQQGERGDKTERSDGLHGFPWTASDTGGDQRETYHIPTVTEGQARTCDGNYEELPASRWRDFPAQSPVCTGDDGFPGRLAGITFPKWRVETIKALGNAMVPQVVYEIFRAIAQVENEKQKSI